MTKIGRGLILRRLLGGLAVMLGTAGAAQAAGGYVTTNVNLRAGPSTAYPAVAVLQGGTPLEIVGCLEGVTWCDVEWQGYRGWVSGRYIEYVYQGRRVLVPDYAPYLGLPVIGFSFNDYWGSYYRGRSWYSTSDRWGPPPPYYGRPGYRPPPPGGPGYRPPPPPGGPGYRPPPPPYGGPGYRPPPPGGPGYRPPPNRPPEGRPPPGRPPQGGPPPNRPPQGGPPPNRPPQQGGPSQGRPPEGRPPQGRPPQGGPPPGRPPQGGPPPQGGGGRPPACPPGANCPPPR